MFRRRLTAWDNNLSPCPTYYLFIYSHLFYLLNINDYQDIHGVSILSVNKFSSAQLAVIAAVIMVIADVIGLISALAAFNEEQQSKEETKRELINIIKYLQDKL